ncbi:hypothetical protein MAR_037716 [Mya arenaria]|uniref:Uncharacterized protein n=1 Tax=Mya arenaria TaxID=6604 RepID=A0ABY7FR31_MYAAR|nr:hypothetical protein MAR_037716 [Mya arenaria]
MTAIFCLAMPCWSACQRGNGVVILQHA